MIQIKKGLKGVWSILKLTFSIIFRIRYFKIFFSIIGVVLISIVGGNFAKFTTYFFTKTVIDVQKLITYGVVAQFSLASVIFSWSTALDRNNDKENSETLVSIAGNCVMAGVTLLLSAFLYYMTIFQKEVKLSPDSIENELTLLVPAFVLFIIGSFIFFVSMYRLLIVYLYKLSILKDRLN
ncbi:hypothetical protein [Mucilaginibacter sp. MD40]|uniref:hypothetical protein n=1 Tax=Mucilaginibacter sp. MD40 TaxID=2029590 RepID=UPI000BACA940|nr:hypothetical protein [Mucilaginibacter sp. MD40]